MRIADGWTDYELIDASGGNRLERWGSYILVRPDPQIIWDTPRENPLWERADAVYMRASSGGGRWEYKKRLPDEWRIGWDGKIKLYVTPTGFKHTGVFPEQAANWSVYEKLIAAAHRPVSVLNLFGYTGAATVACLRAGASVCHVDASRGMVAAAKRNVALNGLADAPVRYIVDDCAKFVAREIRRGVRYDAVIMDPPSYGRGPSGEMWRLEDNIYALVGQCREALSERPLFFTVNSYTAGLAPSVTGYIVSSVLRGLGGSVRCDEIGLPVTQSGLALPCGGTAMFISDEVSSCRIS
ncbi:MAG: class I SAM-dependent methyltransferase [Oscillospiraceae bacterium]|nr:class I SAM-dependent methyltransferase [Oscillospiraceae bacterium]